jgi:transcriptional regulator with XRE-family HTH domain
MNKLPPQDNRQVIDRIIYLRTQHFGPRGKARFAKALGISPSTYNYYEKDRVPPSLVLVNMARVTGVDLNWLLTGEGRSASTVAGLQTSRMDEQIVHRLAKVLGQRPGAAGALAALADLLEKRAQQTSQDTAPQGLSVSPSSGWIPVLGRTAAGVAQFWRDREALGLRNQYQAALQGLSQTADVASVVAEALDGSLVAGQAAGPAAQAETLGPKGVRLVQLVRPVELWGLSVSEFLDAGPWSARRSGLFALRVDGQSMSPALEHGDMVVLSPDRQVEDGEMAVVQLGGQMGLTCKLIRREAGKIHLIPINEDFVPSVHASEDVMWALAVLAQVRLG